MRQSKNRLLFLVLIFYRISICYSATLPDELFSPPLRPINDLLSQIRSFMGYSPSECLETLPTITEDISLIIKKGDFLYKCAKYGDKKALDELRKEASDSPYYFALISKYMRYTGSNELLMPSIFLDALKEKLTALFEFQKIDNPLLNIALALYHQSREEYSLAEQFANSSISQGVIEGYNLVGNFYKKTDKKKALLAYFNSAYYNNPTGIYKLASLCPLEDKDLIEDLYKHACMSGNHKAYFALARIHEKKRQRAQSIKYISHLIETSPHLYVRMEQKKGLGHTAFYVFNGLLKREPSLALSLLESIYKHNSSRRKTISHFLASTYTFGKYGLPESRKEGRKWLEISAKEYGNVEDAYRLCYLSLSDADFQMSGEELIAIGQELPKSCELLDKYGIAPQILFVRLLVAEAEKRKDPELFEEAAYWFLNALSNFNNDSARRKRLIWQIPETRTQGKFPELEDAYLRQITEAATPIERQKKLYDLGFFHLSGGFEEIKSLTKAQHYLFESESISPDAVYFYVTTISHHLSLQKLMHSLSSDTEERGYIYKLQENLRIQKARRTFLSISELIERYRELTSEEKQILGRKIKELSFSNLNEAAVSLASWFRHSMYGLSHSTEHEIYWLKLAAIAGDSVSQKILNSRYPLALNLKETDEEILHHSRTHSQEKPDLIIVGGGISGVMTAISFAKAIREGKLGIGKIKLVEQKDHLLTGASVMVSRQHRGGEYAKDLTTARQCLYSTVIWWQMYHTQRMLTEKKTNDFLLAKTSQELKTGDAALDEEALLAHYTLLNEDYEGYLRQLIESGKTLDEAEKILFGTPPVFRKIEKEELEALGLGSHFSGGISTGERGFNPIGIGTTLEFLLRFYEVEVITGYEVTDIKSLPRGGFEIEGRGEKPLYSQYLINAAWHNNSKLASFLKRSTPVAPLSLAGLPTTSTPKRVFLRSLALIDISRCTLPDDRSFFGLVGEYGGMVSCFNDWVATVFIPKEGLSYHGEYALDEDAVNLLPSAARRKLDHLEFQKMTIAERILDDAKMKYPFLENATPKGLYIQTAVSENLDAIFKRTHSDAKWVEGVEGCLQICATKATFAPFQALQALARFIADRPCGLQVNFEEEEVSFLAGLIDREGGESEILGNIILPDHFKIVTDDDFMSEDRFLYSMRRYAFQRGLDFALFEKTQDAAEVGLDATEQLATINREEKPNSINLEHHTINQDLSRSFFPFLNRVEALKLGSLEEAINDDEDDKLGGEILATLYENSSLNSLTLKEWNLTFSSRYQPFSLIFQRLEEAHLKGVTLTLRSVQALFRTETPFIRSLKKLSIVNSNLRKKNIFKELMNGLQKCENLEFLDLSGNHIGKDSVDEANKGLECFLRSSRVLKKLHLHNNFLFEHISVPSFSVSLPLDLQADPFLLALTSHPFLEEVSITNNGPSSILLQDYLDSYFIKKYRH